MSQPHPHPQHSRRNFLVRGGAIAIGAVAMLVPAVSGLLVLLNPLRRKSADAGAVRVASLKALPENGEPRKFPVLATKVDAWNRTPNVPVGAVYLRRISATEVKAFNVVCPHAGCFVDFQPAKNHYHCPCHDSTFALDGKVLDPKSPSPRALDELTAEVRNGDEIWVNFQNYRAGVKERVRV